MEDQAAPSPSAAPAEAQRDFHARPLGPPPPPALAATLSNASETVHTSATVTASHTVTANDTAAASDTGNVNDTGNANDTVTARFHPSDPTAGPSSVVLNSPVSTSPVTPSHVTANTHAQTVPPQMHATAQGGEHAQDGSAFPISDSIAIPTSAGAGAGAGAGADSGTGTGAGAPFTRPIKLNISALAAVKGAVPTPSTGARTRGRGRGRGGGPSSRRVPGGGAGGRASTRISQRTDRFTHGHTGSGTGHGGGGAGGGGGGGGAGGGGGGGGLKLSLRVGGAEGGGRKTSFLGDYDRELDENPDDPLAFEEQFILRVPHEVADGPGGLREMVKGKGRGLEGVEFKFLDSRRAAFKINGATYASKLVDLPNIIESQKTFDNRHLFKVADISQMLVVENPVKDESYVTQAPLKVDDYVWPHGITPPLRHVRKRRFRKRMSRQTIEVVEEKVEELLKKDAEADKTDAGPATTVELLDIAPDPDVPDEYYINYDPNAPDDYGEGEYGSEYGGSEMYDDPGSITASQMDYDDGQYAEDGEEGEGEEDEDGAFDEELAAALRDQMEGEGSATGQSDDEGMTEDDDDDEAEKSEDDDDDETAEKKAKVKQFTAEIKTLEGAIEKKRAGFTGGNPIIIRRFEETIAGLQGDIATKAAARQALIDELEEAGRSEAAAASQAADAAAGSRKKGKVVGQGTGDNTPGDEDGDVEMGDVDAEGEEEEGSAATPVQGTPDVGEGRLVASEEEEEDLFGDAEAEDDEASGAEGDKSVAPAKTKARAKPGDGGVEGDLDGDGDDDGEEDGEGEGEGDGEGEEDEQEEQDDEMAEMLRAALADPDSDAAQQPGLDPQATAEAERKEKQADADATAALDELTSAGGMEQLSRMAQAQAQAHDTKRAYGSGSGSGSGSGLGVGMGIGIGIGIGIGMVDGGAGLRRLVQGAEEDGEGEDDSSDESDD